MLNKKELFAIILLAPLGFGCNGAEDSPKTVILYKTSDSGANDTSGNGSPSPAPATTTGGVVPPPIIASPNDGGAIPNPVPVPVPVPSPDSKVLSVSIKSTSGSAPIKGQGIAAEIIIENSSDRSESLVLTPLLTWQDSAVKDLMLPSQKVELAPKEKKSFRIAANSILSDVNNKNWTALTNGKWELAVKLEDAAGAKSSVFKHPFTIAYKRTVNMLVLYQEGFEAIVGQKDIAAAHLTEFTRARKVLEPPTFQEVKVYNNGYSELASVDFQIKALPGCVIGPEERVSSCAEKLAGFAKDSDTHKLGSKSHRGFDVIWIYTDRSKNSMMGAFSYHGSDKPIYAYNPPAKLASNAGLEPHIGPGIINGNSYSFAVADIPKHIEGWKAFDELMKKR